MAKHLHSSIVFVVILLAQHFYAFRDEDKSKRLENVIVIAAISFTWQIPVTPTRNGFARIMSEASKME